MAQLLELALEDGQAGCDLSKLRRVDQLVVILGGRGRDHLLDRLLVPCDQDFELRDPGVELGPRVSAEGGPRCEILRIDSAIAALLGEAKPKKPRRKPGGGGGLNGPQVLALTERVLKKLPCSLLAIKPDEVAIKFKASL